MKGIHFDGTTMRYRTDLPKPVRAAGEALIRVRYAGLCRTDREIARGYMRFTGIPGHEFIGTVVETDDPSLVGASVTGDINLACHDCPTCAQGRYHHCPTRTTLGIFRKDGVMAEYATLPARNLYVLPEGLSPVHGAFIEPLAAALEIVSVRPFAPERPVLVIGDGILSYLIVGVLSLRGNAVTLIGKHDDKMRIFGERYPRISLRSHRDGVGDDRSRFPVVVEASGTPGGFSLALDHIEPLGTLFAKSTFAGTLTVDFNRVVVDEITVIGTRCGPFAPAIELLAQGLVDPLPFVEAVISLEEAARVLSDLSGTYKKYVVECTR